MPQNVLPTSLYGTVRKVGSSQFTFDKIYSTRQAMENAIAGSATDGVYHGRYVLVTYGDRHSASSQIANQETTIIVDGNSYTMNLDTTWLTNYNTDLNAYQNIYDNTVWQKIFEGNREKYIMVAALNARAPGLTINKDHYSFKLSPASQNAGQTYWVNGTEQNNLIAEYSLPRWDETYSNDLVYHLDMPMPLRLNLTNQPEFFAEGLDAINRSENSDADINATTAANYIHWNHIADSNNLVSEANFDFHVPALGQAISDAYDALYGIPLDENDEPTGGRRPFCDQTGFINLKQETQDALAQTGYKGILYILDHIGLKGLVQAVDDNGDPMFDENNNPIMVEHYLLSSDWNAGVGQFGHIDNKPETIYSLSTDDENSPYVWQFSTTAPATT